MSRSSIRDVVPKPGTRTAMMLLATTLALCAIWTAVIAVVMTVCSSAAQADRDQLRKTLL
jgi:hypothetical protein